jgi:hypothetical protein
MGAAAEDGMVGNLGNPYIFFHMLNPSRMVKKPYPTVYLFAAGSTHRAFGMAAGARNWFGDRSKHERLRQPNKG